MTRVRPLTGALPLPLPWVQARMQQCGRALMRAPEQSSCGLTSGQGAPAPISMPWLAVCPRQRAGVECKRNRVLLSSELPPCQPARTLARATPMCSAPFPAKARRRPHQPSRSDTVVPRQLVAHPVAFRHGTAWHGTSLAHCPSAPVVCSASRWPRRATGCATPATSHVTVIGLPLCHFDQR